MAYRKFYKNYGQKKYSKSKVYAKFAVGYTARLGKSMVKVIQVRQRMLEGVRTLSYQVQYLAGEKKTKWVTPYELKKAYY